MARPIRVNGGFVNWIEKGFKDLSAQSLREQYILKQREQGMDLFSIARELGLKTLVTLEKYK